MSILTSRNITQFKRNILFWLVINVIKLDFDVELTQKKCREWCHFQNYSMQLFQTLFFSVFVYSRVTSFCPLHN